MSNMTFTQTIYHGKTCLQCWFRSQQKHRTIEDVTSRYPTVKRLVARGAGPLLGFCILLSQTLKPQCLFLDTSQCAVALHIPRPATLMNDSSMLSRGVVNHRYDCITTQNNHLYQVFHIRGIVWGTKVPHHDNLLCDPLKVALHNPDVLIVDVVFAVRIKAR
jgi:hypothetical protein